MKEQETIQRFIELRSQGLTYAKIAEELQVARRTLINWSRQYQYEIQNLRSIEWEAFTNALLASNCERLKGLNERLQSVETELASRDLASVSTPQLEIMAERLRRRLEREKGRMMFTAPDTSYSDGEHPEQVQDWQP
jgi:orotate phosphoribosyltransferase-like protein